MWVKSVTGAGASMASSRDAGAVEEDPPMKIRDFCSKKVITVAAAASLREASNLMRAQHTGALIAVETKDGEERPVGILTDRDIVIAVLGQPGALPDGVRVCDIMSAQLAVAREDDGVFEASRTMREHGVRRLPVVSGDGALRGMVTFDDILSVVSTEMGNLAAALKRGTEREALQQRLDRIIPPAGKKRGS